MAQCNSSQCRSTSTGRSSSLALAQRYTARATIMPAVLLLAGCGTVGTLTSLATAPIRVTGKAVDLATTSQSEADEKRGRDMRLAERERGKLARDYERWARNCQLGDRKACAKQDAARAQLEQGPQARDVRPD